MKKVKPSKAGESMNKKNWKQVDKNFIFALILTSVLLLLAVSVSLMCYMASSDLDTLKNSMNGKLSQKPIEDVAGYALILEGLGYGMGSLGLFLIKLLFVWLPFLLGCYIFIFALIAKLVYGMSDRRILIYRILMGMSFSGQMVMLLTSLILTTAGGWLSAIGLVSSVCVFLIIFLGMRGTYTKRLIQGKPYKT